VLTHSGVDVLLLRDSPISCKLRVHPTSSANGDADADADADANDEDDDGLDGGPADHALDPMEEGEWSHAEGAFEIAAALKFRGAPTLPLLGALTGASSSRTRLTVWRAVSGNRACSFLPLLPFLSLLPLLPFLLLLATKNASAIVAITIVSPIDTKGHAVSSGCENSEQAHSAEVTTLDASFPNSTVQYSIVSFEYQLDNYLHNMILYVINIYKNFLSVYKLLNCLNNSTDTDTATHYQFGTLAFSKRNPPRYKCVIHA
jgi:hypothetical protein